LLDSLLASRLTVPFATPTGGGGLQGRSFNEEFDGDFGGVFYRRTIQVTLGYFPVFAGTKQVQVGTQKIVILPPNQKNPITITVPVFANVPVFVNTPITQTRSVLVPVPGRYSGILITDNDSPRPSDRLYFGFSHYNDIGSSLNPGLTGIDLNRGMFGFEKTVFGDDLSIGLRVPLVGLNAPFGLAAQTVGDLSVLFKYAFVNDRVNQNYLSVGLVVTTPTSSVPGVLSDGSAFPNSVLLQPWTGFVRSFDWGYLQGISNLVVPTDGRDVILLGNSLATGIWLYRGNPDRLLPALTPTFECHVRTPLNNRDRNGLIFLQDMVNLTSGLHLRWRRLVISGAVSVPVVGPRPWNIEAISNVNWRF
jgi:hypothetical protein